jgi:hypothetical protein
VVSAIADADIVVGKARAALEGMSCARAVYIFDEFGGDGWVTPENYASLEADNFAGQASAEPCDVARDLDDYRPDMGWINRELIRRHHSSRRHVNALVEVLRGSAPRQPERVTAIGEISRLARAGWDAERRALTLEAEAVTLRERTIAAEWKVEESRQHLLEVEAQSRAHASEVDAWRGRAEQAEAEVTSLQGLLDTRRVRIGLTAGRMLDRLRAWR